jgi:hypothetical protein
MTACPLFQPPPLQRPKLTRTVYICNFAWLGVLLLASVALLRTGTASLVLQLRCTLVPDMLRYVASITYSNPHGPTPLSVSALDGMERTELLRNLRVRIGDIRGDREVGEAAFITLDDVETGGLERRRLYA